MAMRWMTEFAKRKLTNTSEEEVEYIRTILAKYGIETDSRRFCEMVENSCLDWNDEKREITLRIPIFKKRTWIDDINQLDMSEILKAAKVVAREHGLEIGEGSIFIEDEWKGASVAYEKRELGLPNGHFKPYCYIGLTCSLDQFDALLEKTFKLIPKIENLAKDVAIQFEKERLREEKKKTDRIEKLTMAAMGKTPTS